MSTNPVATFSDFIVYVDESGDHDLTAIRSEYPMFVLAFCIFRKDQYADVACPALQRLKFSHFGHDMVIMHERDIRKAEGAFKHLFDRHERERFMNDLSNLVSKVPFTIIAVAIDKLRHRTQYQDPGNPYHLALEFGLERLRLFLDGHGQQNRKTHLVFERRGKAEDDALELEFHRLIARSATGPSRFAIEFADKKSNSCGLQLADLVARPIGLHILRPQQENRAWSILEHKFRRSPSGEIRGWGLKVFP